MGEETDSVVGDEKDAGESEPKEKQGTSILKSIRNVASGVPALFKKESTKGNDVESGGEKEDLLEKKDEKADEKPDELKMEESEEKKEETTEEKKEQEKEEKKEEKEEEKCDEKKTDDDETEKKDQSEKNEEGVEEKKPSLIDSIKSIKAPKMPKIFSKNKKGDFC